MKKKWETYAVPFNIHPQKEYITHLSRQSLIEPFLGYHLFLQGINTEEKFHKFFFPTLLDCHNPFLLNDMKTAVIRIIQAINRKEKIVIFGDYDCDGITSSTIMVRGLQKLGAIVSSILPLRSEGYGLTASAIDKLAENVSLIITVDNGSSAHDALKAACKKGIDVIVTDHHEILSGHPDCYAFINPKRSDNTYPFPSLSGAGVALKTIQALLQFLKRDWIKESWDYIELAALGTIADVMPLVGENRLICWSGLYKIRRHPSPVFREILNLLKISHVDSSTFGFSIGPIFNACGRIDDPNIATRLLQKNEINKEELESLLLINEKRKRMTTEQFRLANEIIDTHQFSCDSIIVIQGDFHHGIIGILASKIVEKYNKPAIVISKEGTGSARTVNGTGFSIIKPIQKCANHLKKYGGHEGAAGFSINPTENNITEFRKAIQIAALEQKMKNPVLTYTANFQIQFFPTTLFNDLSALEPFGIGNPKPIFRSNKTSKYSYSHFGKDQLHTRFQFSKKIAYAYFKSHSFQNNTVIQPMDILFSPNSYSSHDFIIEDFRFLN
jgi:single-stranded-DNA-specific exonuclease